MSDQPNTSLPLEDDSTLEQPQEGLTDSTQVAPEETSVPTEDTCEEPEDTTAESVETSTEPEEPVSEDETDSPVQTEEADGVPSESNPSESTHEQRHPIKVPAIIVTVLLVVISLFSVFVFGVNVLIAHPVLLGNRALRQGDLRTCYTAYADSYGIASSLNQYLFPEQEKTWLTNGSNTLANQIEAMAQLNGPFQAGQIIQNYFGINVPRSLRPIYQEYMGISAFVEAMQTKVSDYQKSLKKGDTGSYKDLVALVDETVKELPDTPDYMVQYYRFSVSYSMADNYKRTCKLLDKLYTMAPNSLWLYASEGIRAYNLNEEYDKALLLCNGLMKSDASNSATIAYTMQELRLLQKYEEALQVYDKAIGLTVPSGEMERQRAIVLMLQGKAKDAEEILVDSFTKENSTLEHLATLAICAHINGSQNVFDQYKTMLDGYMPYQDVDAFVAGEKTLEDIFLSRGGEVQ